MIGVSRGQSYLFFLGRERQGERCFTSKFLWFGGWVVSAVYRVLPGSIFAVHDLGISFMNREKCV
jgi:hypothetical protein